MIHWSIDLIILFKDGTYSKLPKKKYITNKTNVCYFDDTWSSGISKLHEYGPEIIGGYKCNLSVLVNFVKFVWIVLFTKPPTL